MGRTIPSGVSKWALRPRMDSRLVWGVTVLT